MYPDIGFWPLMAVWAFAGVMFVSAIVAPIVILLVRVVS